MTPEDVEAIVRLMQAESLKRMQFSGEPDWATAMRDERRYLSSHGEPATADMPAPASPPLPDESKLPQDVALADDIRLPEEGDAYAIPGGGWTLCFQDHLPEEGLRHILTLRPEQPPANHVHWDRVDGGGLRLVGGGEWCINDNGDACCSAGGCTFLQWMLSPTAPKGYHHEPKAEGGGYRIWKGGEFVLAADGTAMQTVLDGNTCETKAWIIAPDTPSGVLFVEDNTQGDYYANGDEFREANETTMFSIPRFSRVDLTPAQMQQVLAIVEGE